MWICIGFLIINFSSLNVHYSSNYLGTFSQEQACLDYGEKWTNNKKDNHTDADYICELDTKSIQHQEGLIE